jgi:non-ribosomal peptide synthetase component E (peptide arylation enzyme)
MLEQNAAHFGSRAALLCDGHEPLSHQQLRDQVAATVPALNRLGVGHGSIISEAHAAKFALTFKQALREAEAAAGWSSALK